MQKQGQQPDQERAFTQSSGAGVEQGENKCKTLFIKEVMKQTS